MKEIRTHTLEEIRKFGYRANSNLPLLDEGLKVIRDQHQLANRINILHLLYATSLEGSKSVNFYFNFIQKQGWTQHLTPKELAYFKAGKLSKADRINFSWYKEAIFALVWAGGLVDQIRDLNQIDMATIYHLIPPEASDHTFLKSLKIRDEKILLRELDLFYLLHWSAKHEKKSAGLFTFLTINKTPELSVVVERRHALEWLFCDDEWDEISLDT